MKNPKNYMDLGSIFDEIFEATQGIKNGLYQRHFNPHGTENPGFKQGPFGFSRHFADENTDFYPNYSYPPMNIFMTGDRSLVFEFALAGFNEKDISLSFQGDYMIFAAKIADNADTANFTEENNRYFKRRLKMKDIEKQKYFVPMDKYAQDKVKAIFKNGILKVSVPPKDEPDSSDGIRVEIISESD